jgi:Na+/H+ antiporter NhaC
LLRLLLLFAALLAAPVLAQSEREPVEVVVPPLVLDGNAADVEVRGMPIHPGGTVRLGTGEAVDLVYDEEAGVHRATLEEAASGPLVVEAGGQTIGEARVRTIPGWWSILPPIIAIGVALAFKRVIPALFLGVWAGAWIVDGRLVEGIFWGMLNAFQVFILNALADADHAAIVLFSLMIGGMVGIISRNGGTFGIVGHLVRFASSSRRGQISTALLGLVIFFDDYANTLVVGNTMRPVTDRLRISREKLAYLVDSTAAPIACLAFVTTWIGYQVGLIGTASESIPTLTEGAYSIFLNSILYSFYPIFCIVFLGFIAFTGRDFGPMRKAEIRARTTGAVLGDDAIVDASADSEELMPVADKPQRAINALVPVAVLVIGVLAGLYYTGVQSVGAGAGLREIIGDADSYRALMWASLASVLVAAGLSLGQRILTVDQTIDAWYNGMKSMLLAMIILVMAWALSAVTEALSTAAFLTSALDGILVPGIVPTLVFLLAAATAFSTGTSWGTMGILMPIVVPLSWGVLAADGLHTDAEYHHILYSTVSAVLAGAVWGDHCSPISDTTILSSMASGCDHIAHVRTQLPYALTVGAVAILIGTLPTGFGAPWWLSMPIGIAILFVISRYAAKPVPLFTQDAEVVHTPGAA